MPEMNTVKSTNGNKSFFVCVKVSNIFNYFQKE